MAEHACWPIVKAILNYSDCRKIIKWVLHRWQYGLSIKLDCLYSRKAKTIEIGAT